MKRKKQISYRFVYLLSNKIHLPKDKAAINLILTVDQITTHKMKDVL